MNIQESIERIQNSKKLSTKMAEESGQFAEQLCVMMQDVGINSLMLGKYSLGELSSNVATFTELFLNVEGDYCKEDQKVRIECTSIGNGIDYEYMHQDFRAAFLRPTKAQVLEFANDAPALLLELAELGEEFKEFPKIAL